MGVRSILGRLRERARRAALGVLWPGLTYCQDGLATEHACPFLRDARFLAAYDLGKRTGSWGWREIHWRAYVACWAAQQVAHLPGDFVECGVNRGGLARAVMHYLDFARLDKTFYLLDTFCGVPEESISPEERRLGRRPGGYAECYAAVQETFKDFPNVRLVRGVVPETLPLVEAEQVCYLSLDMNVAAPEVAAAEFFWDKMPPGAVILSDDYGWRGFEPQRRALDGFAARVGVQVLALPTGQGLIIKR